MPLSSLNIGVIGAGNIGTAMAALLSRSSAKVHLAVRGTRLQTVRAEGVHLDDRGTIISACLPCGEVLPVPMDAIFVCVKSQSLAQAISCNQAAIGPETLIIPMVNGLPFWFNAMQENMGDIPYLDPNGALADLLKPKQVLGAVLLMTVKMDARGHAISSNTPTLSLGAVTDGTNASHIDRLASTLEEAGVRTEVSPDIRKKLLIKLLANLSTNPLTALSGATLAEVGQDETLRDIATSLADEYRTWVKSEGYDLPDNKWLVDLLIDAGDFPTSMLQDARAGRALELDAICRAPLELARRAGQSMPVLSRLIAQVESAPKLPLSKMEVSVALQTVLPAPFSPERISL